ncbi:MAG TPA: IS4/IS5 family transposase, partial [Euryarchaeota archaeon]|nr:IS4/IS5 family transposase [Euryarchaeota archaeon]
VASLTQEDAWLLGFNQDAKTGFYMVPSASTLHHFIKYRLKEDGITEVMLLVGKKMVQSATSKHAKTDSTPLEASRYDKYADYNPHYGCKMYKAHITLVGSSPIYMNFTRGNAGDSPELLEHIQVLKSMDAKIDEYLLDSGYDSYVNHADIWYHLGATPRIYNRENAAINNEGTVERIDHWVNKKWKEGGNIHMPLMDKLRFLYKHGKAEQVGAYFRNQSLQDDNFGKSYKERSECERINDYIKDTVKFNVKGIPNDSKELYSKLSFVAYQMMILNNIQNGIEPVNSFARYF